MVREEIIGDCRLILGDCMDVMPSISGISAVITDPPYMGVVKDDWDNQWDTDGDFLRYVGLLLDLFDQMLESNGSLYFFASARMAARIEIEIRKRFNMLNSIVWDKAATRKGVAGTGIDVTALRRFWSASSERVLFAEKVSADQQYQDAVTGENATYWGACESAKVAVLGDYIKAEIERAGATRKEIAELFPSKTGGITGCVSNWINGNNFPTAGQYSAIREHLNGFYGGGYLRREYEDLRREYEDLRRPFYLTKATQWCDVWDFQPPRSHGRHPCEKPVSIMNHIVTASTRKGDTVLDAFMGTGTTGVAAARNGRNFVGCEIEPKYFDIACSRIEKAYKTRPRLFDAIEKKPPEQGVLF